MSSIGILGAGTWGMALARMLYNSGHPVTVWSAVPGETDALKQTRVHPKLPGMILPQGICYTDALEEVCAAQLVLFAVPSIYVRQTARRAAPYLRKGQLITDVAKGIEADTLMMMTEIIREEAGDDKRVVALSGPTHAEEVALDLPTTVVSACEDEAAARAVQDVFMNTCMRVYTNPDVKGVQLCGALKNIMALVAGVSDGLGFGDNAKAMIITRGMAEITRLGLAMGCDPRTFAGLAGIGDLIVTATSRHSRNNQCGHLIGQGLPPMEAVKQVGMVVEGINALPAALQLKEKYQVSMPLIEAADAVINHGVKPSDMVKQLMEREKKS